MRIILSPAKKMRFDDGLPWVDYPVFLNQTQRLMEVLQGMNDTALKQLWKCNDQIAALNVERLERMDLRKNRINHHAQSIHVQAADGLNHWQGKFITPRHEQAK